MLKKLIRYDLKAVSKIWLIGLVSTFALSIVAGICGNLLYNDREYTTAINVLSIFVIVIACIAVAVFAIGMSILIYVRFYKHFYTDEGYLTFTLPVKRSQLLNSKLISGALIHGATMLVVFIEVVIALVITAREDIFSPEAYKLFQETIIAELRADNELLWGLIIICAEIIVSAILTVFASLLFTYLCISIGCSVTRKNKVLTAVGIYYGATGVLTFIIQIISLFGISGITALMEQLPEDISDGFVLLGLTVPILFLATIAAILYGLNYWILDKKLNLT